MRLAFNCSKVSGAAFAYNYVASFMHICAISHCLIPPLFPPSSIRHWLDEFVWVSLCGCARVRVCVIVCVTVTGTSPNHMQCNCTKLSINAVIYWPRRRPKTVVLVLRLTAMRLRGKRGQSTDAFLKCSQAVKFI